MSNTQNIRSEQMKNNKFTCAICRKESSGCANNPFPVITEKDAECCNDCNANVVLPARFSVMMEDTFSQNTGDLLNHCAECEFLDREWLKDKIQDMLYSDDLENDTYELFEFEDVMWNKFKTDYNKVCDTLDDSECESESYACDWMESNYEWIKTLHELRIFPNK